MTPEQAFAAIRNAIRLENLSLELARKVLPELALVFKQVRQQIEALPAAAIDRELQYRRYMLQLADMFRGVNDSYYQGLSAGLRAEVERQVHWAESYLRVAGLSPDTVEVAAARPPGLSVPISLQPSGPVMFPLGPQFTPTQLAEIASRTEVLGNRLITLFGWGDQVDSPFIKGMIKRVDRAVKTGFLLGQTNDEIARNLNVALNGGVADVKAIARTAVMDMSQRAHEAFWDANDDGTIKLWRWDATFDYRVCLQCAPLDGKEVEDRDDLPHAPIHPNCRCRVLPVTTTELELRRQGESLTQRDEINMVEITKDSSKATGRVYKTPARVDGKKYTKFAREVKVPKGREPTMGFFLERANRDTKVNVLGKWRADQFEKLVQRQDGPGLDPDEALRRVVKMQVPKGRK